jgi:NADH:ubiquinone oxidoreductase subunit H
MPFGCLDKSTVSSTATVVRALLTECRGLTYDTFNLLIENNQISDLKYSLLLILALSSLSVYGIILAG